MLYKVRGVYFGTDGKVSYVVLNTQTKQTQSVWESQFEALKVMRMLNAKFKIEKRQDNVIFLKRA